MICVLDACAMIAYISGEPGNDMVAEVLRDPANRCMAHAVNLCEVYYHAFRVSSRKQASQVLRDLARSGVRTRRDMSTAFWTGIGELKATCKVSLADCFAIQLGRTLDGQVVTSDHHEFDAIARQGICKVKFIR